MSERLINYVAARRKAEGLTQAQLAARVQVSRKTINTIENAVFIPSSVLALRIAFVLKQPVETLFELPPGDSVFAAPEE